MEFSNLSTRRNVQSSEAKYTPPDPLRVGLTANETPVTPTNRPLPAYLVVGVYDTHET